MPHRTPSLFSPDTPAGTPNLITAHCDGGARGNPGPSGYGAEITDAQGNVLAELSEFLGIRTNNFAEYSGLLASLQYALDHGHPDLRVISDSLLMVKQIQGAYKVKSPDLIPLWQEAKRRIAKLDRFEIAHALRHKNKNADRLANQAMDRGMGRGPESGHHGRMETTSVGGRSLIKNPDPHIASQNGVHSLPLRAIPGPSAAPTAPATLDSAPPAGSKPPIGATHISVVRTAESTRSFLPKPAPPVQAEPKPVLPAMLRGFTRNGAIHLLGAEKLPDGIFVKVIPE